MGKISFDQGVYIIEMLLKEEKEIEVGKLGTFEFLPGYYYYIGTAQQNLNTRIERHLSDDKKLRWHIDYLLAEIEVLQVYSWPGNREVECYLSGKVNRFPAGINPVEGFGASDCDCTSHLFYFNYRPAFKHLIHSVIEEKGLECEKRID